MKAIVIALALGFGTVAGLNANARPDFLPLPVSHDGVQVQSQPQSDEPVKTLISNTDLAKPIQDHLANQYNGWAVVKAYKIDTKGVLSYKVLVKKESAEKKLLYDQNGKFIKEELAGKMTSETKQETDPPKQD